MSKEEFIQDWRDGVKEHIGRYVMTTGILAFAVEKYGREKPIGEVLDDVDALFDDLCEKADAFNPSLEQEFAQAKFNHLVEEVLDETEGIAEKNFDNAMNILLDRIFNEEEHGEKD